METRSIKSDFVSDGKKISGYAIVFNQETFLRGIPPRPQGFTEVVKPGSLRIAPDLRLLWGHDRNAPLANQAKGTLQTKIDNKGLWFEAELPDSAVREREAVVRGDADGMSFHFDLIKEKWNGNTRELTDLYINEISITAFPAYKGATVSARSIQRMEMELTLREKMYYEKKGDNT